jgi:hypothetical protein
MKISCTERTAKSRRASNRKANRYEAKIGTKYGIGRNHRDWPLDVVVFPGVGLAGLCFLLSLLAFWLIQREQQREGDPRHGILRAIYTFMIINKLPVDKLPGGCDAVDSVDQVGIRHTFRTSCEKSRTPRVISSSIT